MNDKFFRWPINYERNDGQSGFRISNTCVKRDLFEWKDVKSLFKLQNSNFVNFAKWFFVLFDSAPNSLKTARYYPITWFENTLWNRLNNRSLPKVQEATRKNLLKKDVWESIHNILDRKTGKTRYLPEELDVDANDIKESVFTSMKHYSSVSEIAKFNPKIMLKAIQSTMQQLNITEANADNCRELTFEETFDDIPTDTSSCYPHFVPKSDKDERKFVEHQWGMLNQDNFNFKKVASILFKYPAVVFNRISSKLRNKNGKYHLNTKIRQMFGASFVQVALETKFFSQFLAKVYKSNFVSVGRTRPEVFEQVNQVRRGINEDCSVIAGDIEGMDVNLHAFFVFIMFCSVAFVFRKRRRFVNVLAALAIYHVYTPMLSSNGSLTISFGGNMSGSKFTVLLNTFSLLVGLNYVSLLKRGFPLSEDEVKAQGDDFILRFLRWAINSLFYIMKGFRIKLGVLKTKIITHKEQDIQYLGFDWNSRDGPTQSAAWLIQKLTYPERFILEVKGIELLYLRNCSIMFQVSRGKYIFNTLMPHYEDFWQAYLEGFNPNIRFVDKRKLNLLGNVPLNKLMRFGWRLY